MAVTNYATMNGRLMGETGPNGAVYNHTDALGSVTMTTDQSSSVLNTYTYKPYGTQLSKTGAAPDPRFTWVGTLGYRTTQRSHSEYYVRARHYGKVEGSWITVDPLWPNEPSYGYVAGRPVSFTDASGKVLCPPCQIAVNIIPSFNPIFTAFIDDVTSLQLQVYRFVQFTVPTECPRNSRCCAFCDFRQTKQGSVWVGNTRVGYFPDPIADPPQVWEAMGTCAPHSDPCPSPYWMLDAPGIAITTALDNPPCPPDPPARPSPRTPP